MKAPKKALVVGATGLVGSAVTDKLIKDGWQVTATARSAESVRWAGDALLGAQMLMLTDMLDDLAVSSALNESRPTVVISCVGALPVADGATRDLLHSNVTATAVLLDACAQFGVGRIVLLGSGFEYAPAAGPIDEARAIGPTTLYGATKVAATSIACHYRSNVGLEVCVVRPFSLYGPREHLHRFVPTVVTSALNERPVEMSAGTQVRDYLFVDDLAAGLVRAAGHDGVLPETMNFAGPDRHTLADLATIVLELTGSTAPLRLGARPGNPSDQPIFLGNSRLAYETLGWRPTHDLSSGLERTVEWYRSHRKLWDVAAA